MLENVKQDTSFRNDISHFLEFLTIFAAELKKGIQQDIAALKAYKKYCICYKNEIADCIRENFRWKPNPCSFKERWHQKYVVINVFKGNTFPPLRVEGTAPLRFHGYLRGVKFTPRCALPCGGGGGRVSPYRSRGWR